jgi:hypothetical protein
LTLHAYQPISTEFGLSEFLTSNPSAGVMLPLLKKIGNGEPMKRGVVIVDSTEISRLQVFGEEKTILASNGQTGSYAVYVHDAPQGVGPPHHSHPWDEAFYVIDGAVDFVCRDVAKTFNAGGLSMFQPVLFTLSDTPVRLHASWASHRGMAQPRCSLRWTASAVRLQT